MYLFFSYTNELYYLETMKNISQLSDEDEIGETVYSVLLPLEKSASWWPQEITCHEA